MAILETKNLNYYYQDEDTRRYILKDANTSFEEGKLYAILGQSGSGKTTFLSLISALEKPKSGNVCYKGKDITQLGMEHFRRNNIGMVFQSYNLIPYMTAIENVLVAMDITENELPKNKKEVVTNLLDYIGLSKNKAKRQVKRLSGGEQQRVAIARALATNVDIILADEPTGNLDEAMAMEIVEILKNLAHEHNKCVIVVTHSTEIADCADEVLLLKK